MRAAVAIVTLSLALLLTACGTSPAEEERARAAEEQARAWLAQLNAGDFAGSWETAAPLFRARTLKENWVATARGVHGNLGEPQGRELVAAKYTATLPWDMAGEHVIVQYRVNYRGSTYLETLTMRWASDQQWRAVGINVRRL